jgi:oxalyl-CoA decarboxylase
VLGATLEAEAGAKSLVRVVDAAPRQLPAPETIARALDVLAKAERPLIVLGKGAAYSQADADIRAFIERTRIRFLPMSMAQGLLPDDYPQSAAAARSFALAQADAVMLIGARLNWLLGHGKSPQWSARAQFVQLDIMPMEMDSNRSVAAPVVGDIASSMSALLATLKDGQIRPSSAWLDDLAQHKEKNAKSMASRLAANPDPMDFYSALNAIKGVLADKSEIYLVNEGANTLDIARNVIDMHAPRKRLDSGTWGVMGVGMGYAIGTAVTSGKPVVAIEGDSAFGFSGMEIETICRYRLPVVTVIFNNGGIYRGDGVNRSGGADPAPTVLMKQARDRSLRGRGLLRRQSAEPLEGSR